MDDLSIVIIYLWTFVIVVVKYLHFEIMVASKYLTFDAHFQKFHIFFVCELKFNLQNRNWLYRLQMSKAQQRYQFDSATSQIIK